MALLDSLLAPVFSFLNRLLSPLRKLVDKFVTGWQHLLSIGTDTTHLVETIKNEVEAWKNFKSNPRFKSRVISVPIAFEKTKELIAGIPQSWNAIVDLFKQLREKVQAGGDPKAETEEFAADLESGEGISGLLRRAPKLVKGLEKLFGFLAIAVDALESISSVIQDLQTIVDELARIRSEIEDLDSIFLSQKNKRRLETLTDGSKIQIRVGSLHK